MAKNNNFFDDVVGAWPIYYFLTRRTCRHVSMCDIAGCGRYGTRRMLVRRLRRSRDSYNKKYGTAVLEDGGLSGLVWSAVAYK
jgi:hypothetical protein